MGYKMQQLYTAKGVGFEVTPAGLLLLAGDTAHGDMTQTTIVGRCKATEFIKHVLFAATLAGYQHGDLLLTLLQWNVQSERVRAMAQKACDMAGDGIVEWVFRSYKDGVNMSTVSMLFDRPLTALQPVQDRIISKKNVYQE
jgi:hypothetical protein